VRQCWHWPSANLEIAKNIFWEYWLKNCLSYFLGISNSLAQKLRQNFASARGLPVLHCLVGDAYWFLVLFFYLSRFQMTKFVITEMLLSSVIFKTVMVSLHWGRFAVVHLYSGFPIDPQIFLEGQMFTQNFFWRFVGP